MKRWLLFISFCYIFFLATEYSYAAGIIMRIQQMKAQKQGQMTPEQYQQYQEYQEQQQGVQGQTPQAPAPPTYQQTVDERNQAIAQAILDAHNQAVNNPSQGVGGIQGQQQAPSPASSQQQPAMPSMNSTDVKDTVDLSEVWKKLDKKSTVWALLIDDQAKLLTVSEYISRFQQEGVKINESPNHYVQMIDQISQANPQMLEMPFGQLIQVLAIVDYDFDNGMDKDALAKKVLGEAGYEANKKRFSQQQQQPQQQ